MLGCRRRGRRRKGSRWVCERRYWRSRGALVAMGLDMRNRRVVDGDVDDTHVLYAFATSFDAVAKTDDE